MTSLQAGSLESNICQARPAGQPLTLKLEPQRWAPHACTSHFIDFNVS